MSDTPLVSVVVPVWNGARFLTDAVASIRAQHYAPLEIVIADDGSTDGTAEIATRPELNLVHLALPHRGLAATRLAGIERARGELIAFLDVDDLWHASKLAVQIELLKKNPETMIVNGYTQLMRLADAATMRFENWGEPVLAPSFGSALFRREGLDALRMGEAVTAHSLDADWLLLARERGIPFLIHHDVVQFYRRHGTNMSNQLYLRGASQLKMLQESLARRKALGKEGQELPPLRWVEK